MLWPNGTTTRPVVTSPFGRRTGGAFSFHYGADLVGYDTVRAAGSGRVTFAGWMNAAAGNTVIIDLGGSVTELHMHLADFAVSKGDRVYPGTPLGRMGRTGNASGNCDHFEIRVQGSSVDPLEFTATRLSGTPAGGGNITPPAPGGAAPILEGIEMAEAIISAPNGIVVHLRPGARHNFANAAEYNQRRDQIAFLRARGATDAMAFPALKNVPKLDSWDTHDFLCAHIGAPLK